MNVGFSSQVMPLSPGRAPICVPAVPVNESEAADSPRRQWFTSPGLAATADA